MFQICICLTTCDALLTRHMIRLFGSILQFVVLSQAQAQVHCASSARVNHVANKALGTTFAADGCKVKLHSEGNTLNECLASV